MTSKLTLALALACVLATVQAYSGGAPRDVCEDMIPKHPVQPQKTQMPYTVKVSKDAIQGGQTVKITISGREGFKGLFVQVRQNKKSTAIGQFTFADKDKYMKAISCGQGTQVIFEMIRYRIERIIKFFVPQFKSFLNMDMLQNAATHKNSESKNNLTLDWKAPSDVKGTVAV